MFIHKFAAIKVCQICKQKCVKLNNTIIHIKINYIFTDKIYSKLCNCNRHKKKNLIYLLITQFVSFIFLFYKVASDNLRSTEKKHSVYYQL